jgi:aspartyl-tRNA(Asn)/glutamyl-tRNA(Gln) amidotransferase subunit C
LEFEEYTMKVDRSEVEHVATLARITLTEREKDLYTEQLSAILEFFDTLKGIDTTKVQPTSHVLEITNVVRNDDVQASLDIQDTLQNAPDAYGRFLSVPKILG